ncbi:proteoglycan 4-like isoform X2 [Sycon ciliatum]
MISQVVMDVSSSSSSAKEGVNPGKKPPPPRPAAPRRPRAAPINCHECGKRVLLADRVAVGMLSLHKECFFCGKCGIELTAESCHTVKGQFYCQKHYKNRSDASDHHDKAPVAKTTSSKQHKRLQRAGGASSGGDADKSHTGRSPVGKTPDSLDGKSAQLGRPAQDSNDVISQSMTSSGKKGNATHDVIPGQQTPESTAAAAGAGKSAANYPGKLTINRDSYLSVATSSESLGRASPVYGPRRDGCSMPDKNSRMSRYALDASMGSQDSTCSGGSVGREADASQNTGSASTHCSSNSSVSDASTTNTTTTLASSNVVAVKAGDSRAQESNTKVRDLSSGGKCTDVQSSAKEYTPALSTTSSHKQSAPSSGKQAVPQGAPSKPAPAKSKPPKKPAPKPPGNPAPKLPSHAAPTPPSHAAPKLPAHLAPKPPSHPAPAPPGAASQEKPEVITKPATATTDTTSDKPPEPTVYASTGTQSGKNHGKKRLPPPDMEVYKQSWAAAASSSSTNQRCPPKRPTDLPLQGLAAKRQHKPNPQKTGSEQQESKTNKAMSKQGSTSAMTAVKPTDGGSKAEQQTDSKPSVTDTTQKVAEERSEKKTNVEEVFTKPKVYAMEIPYQESYIAAKFDAPAPEKKRTVSSRVGHRRSSTRTPQQEVIYHRQKRRAPSIPKHMQRLLGARLEREDKFSLAEIEDKLQQLSNQHRELELHGQRLEEKMRKGTPNEERLMKDWLRLVEEKNQLVAKETELVYMQQDLVLVERRDALETEIRKRMEVDSSRKSKRQLIEEEGLILQLVETVNTRNRLVNMLDLERLV